jgi:hypothetical protein
MQSRRLASICHENIYRFILSKPMDHGSNRNNKEKDKIIRSVYVFNNMSRVFGRYNRVIAETLGLLCCSVIWLGNISPTFRRKVQQPYSRTHNQEYEGSKLIRNVGKAAQRP